MEAPPADSRPPSGEHGQSQQQMLGLVDLLRTLVRRWRWVAGSVVLITGLALAFSLRQPKEYSASADVLLPSVSEISALQSDQPAGLVAITADRQLANALQVIQSGDLQDEVEKRYDGPLDVDSVKAERHQDGSDMVTIKATGTDPKEAADLVNTYAQTYIDYSANRRLDLLQAASEQIKARIADLDQQRSDLQKPLDELDARIAGSPGNQSLLVQRASLLSTLQPQLDAIDNAKAVQLSAEQTLSFRAGLNPESSIQFLTRATPPTDPVSPKPVRDGIIGLMLGLGIGVALSLVREFLDESIRTSSDLEQVLRGRYPVLGIIPFAEDGSLEVGAALTAQSPAAEAYRSLRTSVRFSELEHPMRIIQITSASPGEGKTTTTANLARVLAQAGHRVAVACCDLRRPRVHLSFGVSSSPGLADVVLGERTLNEALRTSENLYVLPAGTAPPNPSELLGTARAQRVMEALAEELDFVVVDSTPVLAVTDAIVVSRFVDATIVVVSAGDTSRRQVEETIKSLELSQAPVIGFVFNRAGAEERNLYGYSYEAIDYGATPGAGTNGGGSSSRGMASTSS
jgi:capsular exopolysaccharide synthesis family protein